MGLASKLAAAGVAAAVSNMSGGAPGGPGGYGRPPAPGGYGQPQGYNQGYSQQSGPGGYPPPGQQQPGHGYPPSQQQPGHGYPPSQQQPSHGYPPSQQHPGYPSQQQPGYPSQQQPGYGQPGPGGYGAAAAGAALGAAAGYGAASYGGGPAGQAGGYYSILEAAVRENRLEAFYPPQRLQQVAASVSGQVQQLAQTWDIPMEIARDLVRLALYDIVLYVDDSGSMAFEEKGERIDDLKLILHRVSFAASLFDTNGIEVRFMNNNYQGNGIRSEQQVGQMMQNVKFQGLTPLGTNLRKKVLDPLVVGPASAGQLQKPVLIITITDGEPAGESSSTLKHAIKNAKHQLQSTRYGPGALALQFGQVGNDLKARAFLASLDNDREVGPMIDCTSNFEVEQDEMARIGVDLSPSLWLVKILVGSIDRSYDKKDERQ
ncbi:hypothetical protein AWJ20_223 [Sugiyamaella lignohabitans]|uniref:VWFA domain-containing protein n=1 Tax=Sugiyamaella lignohabitans TaxID=796027 RepID=A0A167CQT2_9ASCO|nr:uncharacterized protein AWJ20_223 [Sugiyamaella lignohabitans]ANB11995.1 hypothetical protein AWJ20_223 [Sugiyamaella lignohabitans]